MIYICNICTFSFLLFLFCVPLSYTVFLMLHLFLSLSPFFTLSLFLSDLLCNCHVAFFCVAPAQVPRMSEQIKFLQGCHECYRHNRHHSVLYNTSDCRCRRGGYVKSSKSASQSTGMRFLLGQCRKTLSSTQQTYTQAHSHIHTHRPSQYNVHCKKL